MGLRGRPTLRRAFVTGAALAALMVAGPAVAWAEDVAPPVAAARVDAGADEVSLKNGGMLRGTLLAVEPGQKVVILFPLTGEQRVVPWADVAGVQAGKYASAGAGAGAPPQGAPLAAPALGTSSAPAPLSPEARRALEEKRDGGETLRKLGIAGVIVGGVLVVGGGVALSVAAAACDRRCSSGVTVGALLGGIGGITLGVSIIPAGVAGIIEGNSRIRAADNQLQAGALRRSTGAVVSIAIPIGSN